MINREEAILEIFRQIVYREYDNHNSPQDTMKKAVECYEILSEEGKEVGDSQLKELAEKLPKNPWPSHPPGWVPPYAPFTPPYLAEQPAPYDPWKVYC